MRLIASILAIYILLLSCLPCADAETTAGVPVMTATEAAHNGSTNNPHGHHDTAPDLCSPFCHCSCCVVFTIVSNAVIIPVQPAALHTPVLPGYCHTHTNSISLPVWQPPRSV